MAESSQRSWDGVRLNKSAESEGYLLLRSTELPWEHVYIIISVAPEDVCVCVRACVHVCVCGWDTSILSCWLNILVVILNIIIE